MRHVGFAVIYVCRLYRCVDHYTMGQPPWGTDNFYVVWLIFAWDPLATHLFRISLHYFNVPEQINRASMDWNERIIKKEKLRLAIVRISSPHKQNRPFSHSGHFESPEIKKLCFCTSSLALDERLDVQNLLFQHCVIKVYRINWWLWQTHGEPYYYKKNFNFGIANWSHRQFHLLCTSL